MSSGVLFVASGGLGDAVLLAHVFDRFLRLARDDEPVVLLMRADAAGMGFLFEGRAEVMPVDYRRFGKSWFHRRPVIRQLRARRFRLTVNTDFLRHPNLDEKMIFGAEAAETVAMEPRSWPKYDPLLRRNAQRYNRLFDSGPDHLDKVLRWTRYANWLTGRDDPPPVLNFDGAAERGDEVILVPFSAVKEKQVPVDTYLDIIEAVGGRHPIVVAGAPPDPARNPAFKELVERPDVAFDGSKFRDLAPRLKRARLVVSVDTAAMHLAVAMGAPTLCLASAAYVGEIVPYAPEITPPNAKFVYTPMDCQGCLGACIHPPERGVFPCVARLDGDEIVNQVRDSLSA